MNSAYPASKQVGSIAIGLRGAQRRHRAVTTAGGGSNPPLGAGCDDVLSRAEPLLGIGDLWPSEPSTLLGHSLHRLSALSTASFGSGSLV